MAHRAYEYPTSGRATAGRVYATIAPGGYVLSLIKGPTGSERSKIIVPDSVSLQVLIDNQIPIKIGDVYTLTFDSDDIGMAWATITFNTPFKNELRSAGISDADIQTFGQYFSASPQTSPDDVLNAPYPGFVLSTSSGDDERSVVAIMISQLRLKQMGMNVLANGDFDAMTEAAVKEFQKANNLAQDGKIGPRTWAKIEAAYKASKGVASEPAEKKSGTSGASETSGEATKKDGESTVSTEKSTSGRSVLSVIGASPMTTAVQGKTSSGISNPFRLQNFYQTKSGDFDLYDPEVILTKKVERGKDRFILERQGGKSIIVPVLVGQSAEEEASASEEDNNEQTPAPGRRGKRSTMRAKRNRAATRAEPLEEALIRHWTTIILEAAGDSTPEFIYVPLTRIEWVFEGNWQDYGTNALPKISEASYTASTSIPKINGVTFKLAGEANSIGVVGDMPDAVAQGISNYLRSNDPGENPGGRPLCTTRYLIGAMNAFPVKVYNNP